MFKIKCAVIEFNVCQVRTLACMFSITNVINADYEIKDNVCFHLCFYVINTHQYIILLTSVYSLVKQFLVMPK